MEQMHHVREAKRQSSSRLAQNLPRCRITLLDCGHKIPGFAALDTTTQFCQQTIRMSLIQFTDPSIHRPTGAARFDRRTRTIQANVTDLCFSGQRAMVNSSVYDQATADATT